MLFRTFFAPDAPASTGAATQTPEQAPKSPPPGKAVPKAGSAPGKATGEGKPNTASRAVGNRPGDQAERPIGGQAPESAADRAIARKAQADAAEKGTKSPDLGKGKVKTLAELRKLSSKNNPDVVRKTNSVEVDGDALPNARPEPAREGRPDPKVARQRPVPQAALEVEQEGGDEGLELSPEELDAVTVGEVEDEGALTVEEETDPDAYKPNTKVKVWGEEHDIPERFQSLLTDPEAEKEVHDVFQRANAFDKAQARLRAQDQEVRERVLPTLERYDNVRQELIDHASRGDIFGLLEKFGLDENKVLHAAAERVRLLEAGPEVRAQYDRQNQLEKENRELARRQALLEQSSAESAKLVKRSAFESLLAREDVNALKEDFDQRLGKPGTFARMVATHADQVYKNSVAMAQAGRGRVIDLTPEQAVQDFMRVNGLQYPDQSAPGQMPARQPTQGNPPTAQAKPASAPPTQKPRTIPNINSRPTSGTSTKPVFKTAAQIREFAKQRKQQGA